MRWIALGVVTVVLLSGRSFAQEFVIGGPTLGGDEPLYSYDDREPWKHGWIQEIPFYGGYHSFRPYNYKQVYAQTAQSVAWGMPHGLPYSQQYYHRYENLTGYESPGFVATPVPAYRAGLSPAHHLQWGAPHSNPATGAGYGHPVRPAR